MKNIEPFYGSDEHGLGLLFVAGQAARLVDESTIYECLVAPPQAADSFVWLYFSLSNAATEPWLRQTLNLPDAFYESFHMETRSTRIEPTNSAQDKHWRLM